MSFLYPYVGPEAVRLASLGSPAGHVIRDAQSLRAWLATQPDATVEGVTYTVGLDRLLRLAPRRSEHVACAAGGPVLAAGELCFRLARNGIRLLEASNQSTGFCPDVDCWADVRAALTFDGISRLDGFTRAIIFRRCSRCAEVNLVKEGWFVCAFCDTELPQVWNVSERRPVLSEG